MNCELCVRCALTVVQYPLLFIRWLLVVGKKTELLFIVESADFL